MFNYLIILLFEPLLQYSPSFRTRTEFPRSQLPFVSDALYDEIGPKANGATQTTQTHVLHPRRFRKRNVRKTFQIIILICSYIQNLILNLIETLKTSIYSTKHTQNTKLHFWNSHFFRTYQFPKKKTFANISVLCWFLW